MRRTTTIIMGVAAISALAGPAWADSSCDNGERDLKPAEKAFYEKARALKAAFPPAPAGWVVKDEDDDKDAGTGKWCIDMDPGLVSGKSPLRLHLKRSYERADMQERAKKMQADMDAMPKEPSAADKKTIDEDNKKAEAVMAKMQDAIQKKDYDAVQKYQAEYQKYAGEAIALQSKPIVEASKRQGELFKDTKANVSIDVNLLEWDSNYEHPATVAVPGAAGAWREEFTEKDRDPTQPGGWTTILFGPWENREHGTDPYLRMIYADPPVPGGAAIETVWVRIEADTGTAKKLLEGLGVAKLKSAVAKNSLKSAPGK